MHHIPGDYDSCNADSEKGDELLPGNWPVQGTTGYDRGGLKSIMRIYGKAYDVFNSINNICQRNPDMTLREALKTGLLSSNLQYTRLLTIGEYLHVYLNEGFEKN